MVDKYFAFCIIFNYNSLWQVDFDRNGFQWIDCTDSENSIISFIRKAEDGDDYLIIISNFSREEQEEYRLGVPESGFYEEVLNTDAVEFGGKGIKNGRMEAEEKAYHNRSHSITMRIPPLATIYLKQAAEDLSPTQEKTGGSY